MDSKISQNIGDKNKIDMILGLYHAGPSNKSVVYSYTKQSNLNPRKLDELESCGIINMTVNRFENNKTTVELTELGMRVARKLIEIDGIISGEIYIDNDDSNFNHDTSPEQTDSVN